MRIVFLYKRFERLSYWSYSLSACRCCSCWSAVSTLVPPWSTLAFIGDATACPLGNSSVPMKLSTGRKLTGGKEDNAPSWTWLFFVSLCLRFVRFLFVLFFFSVPSRFRVRLIRDRNAFLQQNSKKICTIWYACVNFLRKLWWLIAMHMSKWR